VSYAIQKYLAHGPNRLESFIMPKEDAAFSMISGLVAFKVCYIRALTFKLFCHLL
jgi:hypothetical protein